MGKTLGKTKVNCYEMAATGEWDEDLKFVEKIPQELTCSICMRVLCEPHLVNCCEQQFCKDCLERWLEENTTCPHCRSAYMFMTQKSRKVGELKVFCPNKRHGCKAELKISDCKTHLSTTINDKGCRYVKLDCPNNCAAKVFRGEMVEHRLKQCSKRIVSCTHCKLQGQYLQMVKHVTKCPVQSVACPRECGARVLRKDLQTHKNDCPLEFVTCSFSGLGCRAKIYRKDLQEHIKSSGLSEHLSLLAKAHMTVQTVNTVLQIEHATLNTVCTSLQEELIALQAGHQLLQKEHATLNTMCTSLKEELIALQAGHQPLQKEHATLNTMCTSLQEELIALKAGHQLLQKEHTTLNTVCTSLQEELIALQAGHQLLQKEHTTLKEKCTSQQADQTSLKVQHLALQADYMSLKDTCSTLQRQHRVLQEELKMHAKNTKKAFKTEATSKALVPAAEVKVPGVKGPSSRSTDTSKLMIGSSLFLWLIPGEEAESSHHNILVTGGIQFRLEWEIDDLFPDELVQCFQLRLFLVKSALLCKIEVHVTSTYGDSGELAVICCGKPQTVLWEVNASKQLVGSLLLECNKSDQLRVSLRHHQPEKCRCSCHHKEK